MAKLNKKTDPVRSHEGGKARIVAPELMLRRAVMACMLWEDSFYEDGITVAQRIEDLVPHVDAHKVRDIAIEARSKMYLRHVPLLLARIMAKLPSHREFVAETLEAVIQRADELTEFVAIYWAEGKEPLSAQVKKGLAAAFRKFDEYQLAKYNRDNAVKLRDVLFLCHAKPKDKAQEALWKRLIDGNLKTPDTWEVALSSGGDKKTHWTRLLAQYKLGPLAMIRNLRNMKEAGVNPDRIRDALVNLKPNKVLPFRFIAAARYNPEFEPELEACMLNCLREMPVLPGHTVLLIDVSGSMDGVPVSPRSDITRAQAAIALAMLLREICEKVDIYSFSMALKYIPARHGFALGEAIHRSQQHSGTPLGLAVKSMYAPRTELTNAYNFGGHGSHVVDYQGQALNPDRLIVITDEQSQDPVPNPQGKGYMINVANYEHGVGYAPWVHIDGWSEQVISFIRELENSKLN